MIAPSTVSICDFCDSAGNAVYYSPETNEYYILQEMQP